MSLNVSCRGINSLSLVNIIHKKKQKIDKSLRYFIFNFNILGKVTYIFKEMKNYYK